MTLIAWVVFPLAPGFTTSWKAAGCLNAYIG